MSKKIAKSSKRAQLVKKTVLIFGSILASMASLANSVSVPGPIQKNAYMGASYCASCHQEEFKSWHSSAHQRASETLPKEQRNNAACLSCHATGVLEHKSAVLPGVQCEACHGPGQYYASLHIKKDPVLSKLLFMQDPNQSCRHCHLDKPNLWSGSLKPFHGAREHQTIDKMMGPLGKKPR